MIIDLSHSLSSSSSSDLIEASSIFMDIDRSINSMASSDGYHARRRRTRTGADEGAGSGAGEKSCQWWSSGSSSSTLLATRSAASAAAAAVLLSSAAIFLCGFAAGDPRTNAVYQYCNNLTAESGAVLAVNFVPAMDNLTAVVTQNGYGTSVVGHGPNAVFGLGQCFGDLDSVDCKLCFSEIRSQLPKCYPGIGGRLFLDGCFGRYDNYSFFNDVLDASTDRTFCSNNATAAVAAPAAAFRQTLGDLIGNVSSSARQNNQTKFAVGSSTAAGNGGLALYALAQCWQNLDGDLCGTCIDAAAKSILSCSPATDGRAVNAGCYLRYSTHLFWNVYPPTATSSSSGTSDIIWIVLGTVLGCLLLMVGVVVWKRKSFRRNRNGDSFADSYRVALPASISQSGLNFGYDQIKKATNNFSLSNKVGQGSYGTVYKAVLPDGKEVAVKRLFLNTRQWLDQFYNEVDLVNRVRHKNLVKLLGLSADGPESLLIYEYYSNKSLDLFIFDDNHGKHLDWHQRFDIIQGIAEGLAYLHDESETRIIHRDIKASNILLDDKLKPKITDFGLAKSFAEDQTHLSTGIAGTLGYMAPEYIVHGHLTEKADVYSFGILILEIVSGTRCNAAIAPHGGGLSFLAKIWKQYKANMMDKIINERLIGEEGANKREMENVVKIGLLCTQANSAERPSMAKVVELLRRSSGEEELAIVVPTDPPFLDVPSIEEEEAERDAAHLLSAASGGSLSISMSSGYFGGR